MGKVFGSRHRQRLLLPARVPDALCKMNVDERIAERGKTVPEVSGELLRRHGFDRVERPLLGPVVIVEQLTQLCVIHGHTPDINDDLSVSSGNFISTSGELMTCECLTSSLL